MPNIFHQSIEDILKAATPQQRLLWNHIFLRFGDRVAISQFTFIGAVAGTEILAYVARKLYLAYDVVHSSASVTAGATDLVIYYDENNAASSYYSNNRVIWDATAAAPSYIKGNIIVNNTYFSRIVANNYAFIKFIGY